ncbi:MAG: hypothetical protein PHP99_03850 [Paludibacter sp.]|nr:hypothetical protein [Paludibacter sp.]
MRTRLIFLLFAFVIINHIQAIDFNFRHYKVEEGLSENSVFCSLQDSKGFMWFLVPKKD